MRSVRNDSLTMRKPIDPGLSVYFDAARFLAALIVVLHHVWPLIMPNLPIPWPGHEAVVVFFVLSGYVIAYAASDPTVSLRTYAEHRTARILSVAIPALLLAAAVAPFAAGPDIQYAGDVRMGAEQFWIASVINGLFLGQSLGMNISPPLNEPFWSLCYEVWYYVIFAAWMYSSKRWRIALTVLALAVAGLKIVMLLPVWLLGVWLYHRMPVLTQRQARILFAVSALAAFAFFWTGTSQAIRTALNGENGGNSSAGTAHDRYAATDGVGSHDQFACGIHAQFDMALVGIFGTILQGAVIRLDADRFLDHVGIEPKLMLSKSDTCRSWLDHHLAQGAALDA